MKIYLVIISLFVFLSLNTMENQSDNDQNTKLRAMINTLKTYNQDSLQAINKNGKWFLATYGAGLALLFWAIIDLNYEITPFGIFELGGAFGIFGGSIGSQKNIIEIKKNLEHCKDMFIHESPIPSLLEPPVSWEMPAHLPVINL